MNMKTIKTIILILMILILQKNIYEKKKRLSNNKVEKNEISDKSFQ